ncbi:alpha/beta fold hydrolase [Phaeobacter sp.]|uniref:alpha/beta hydrolase n=1 Tax=Phaeobacter sp. TaxID=1902409 RepID=UPI0025EB2788|nr:alpha/beta fold hydrolase [Phaeobacter sp.]
MLTTRRVFAFCLLIMGLAGCADRSFSPTVPEALQVGTAKTVFAVTTREPLDDGTYGPQRSDDVDLLELTVSVPPNHQPGRLDFGYADPDPNSEFVMAGRHRLPHMDSLNTRVAADLAAYPPNERDVTVFVHGFNSTQPETAFRAAQLSTDIGIPGSTIIYSWPSQGTPLGYAYDGDSVLFARDGLEYLLRNLKPGPSNRVVLVAHSMGSQLVMETLRQIDIKTPGWSSSNLGAVVLMSPDLDVEVFRSQMRRIDPPPEPFIVMVSRKDNVLNLSQRLRGTHNRGRLGNLASLEDVSELPIQVVDTTEYADTAASGHFVAATSPAVLSILSAAREASASFDRDAVPLQRILPGRLVIGTDRSNERKAVELTLSEAYSQDAFRSEDR